MEELPLLPTSEPGFFSRIRPRWQLRLAVAGLVLLVYGPAVRAPFLFDDHVAIEGNSRLAGWSWPAVKGDFSPTEADPWGRGYYRPIETLTHRVDLSVFGLQPLGHHAVNLGFQILNAWLVMELGWMLGLSLAAGALAGGLFGIHPIIVSELLMVSGRSELLSFLFGLGSVCLFARSSRRAALVGAGLFLLALLSKESALAVPLFVAIILRERGNKRHLGWKASLLAVAITLYVFFRLHAAGPIPWAPSASELWHFNLRRFPPVLARAATLLVFPWPLYLYRQMVPPSLLESAALLVSFGVIWRKLRGIPFFTTGVLWFLAAWLPKLPLMSTGSFVLDHWGYAALPGLLWPVACFLCDSPLARASPSRRFIKLLAATLFVGWSFSAGLNIALRNTDEKNYRWSLRFTRATPLYFNLGLICLRTHRPAEALSYFEPVAALYPEDLNIRQAVAAAKHALTSPVSTGGT